ncbi:MAG: Sir2 family NAD-dependent protein deacetylase [Bacteroidota bacterium]|nr:Sir2 family NAD-dependent protein deacetylase [Bacteroidota bacterium]
MPKLCILTGAGMSAESGLKTFRDSDGLWEEYDVMTVASIDGWYKNPQLVLEFYNARRRQLLTAKPNAGHKGLADLEKYFEVQVITQNIDNLHEQAGSSNVLHLHGELTKACSSEDSSLVYDIGYNDIKWGDKCAKGAQLRPFIVWFGEAVPAFSDAVELIQDADAFAVIGSSLNVYPAAGLVNYVPKNVPIFLIDPKEVAAPGFRKVEFIKETAGVGVDILKDRLFDLFGTK